MWIASGSLARADAAVAATLTHFAHCNTVHSSSDLCSHLGSVLVAANMTAAGDSRCRKYCSVLNWSLCSSQGSQQSVQHCDVLSNNASSCLTTAAKEFWLNGITVQLCWCAAGAAAASRYCCCIRSSDNSIDFPSLIRLCSFALCSLRTLAG